MRLYQFKPDPDAFVSYFALTLAEIQLLRLFEPPDPAAFAALELHTDNPDAAPTDFPALSIPTPLLSERALSVVGPLLTGQVDVHPVQVHGRDGFKLHALRVPCVTGAVDLARSDCTVNSIARSVSMVRALSVDLSRLPDAPVFKLHETRNLHSYVSEAFIAVVESAGLRGFDYREIPLV